MSPLLGIALLGYGIGIGIGISHPLHWRHRAGRPSKGRHARDCR
ncbi:hypothetical protein AB0H86_09915 [Streptomyces sp. NPDC050997]